VLHAPAPRASSVQPSVPEGLDALIAALLEKERAKRPVSADAVIEALDRIASPLAWTQRDAKAWWDAHQAALAASDKKNAASPPSNGAKAD
jgi:hypothetical protein